MRPSLKTTALVAALAAGLGMSVAFAQSDPHHPQASDDAAPPGAGMTSSGSMATMMAGMKRMMADCHRTMEEMAKRMPAPTDADPRMPDSNG